MATTRIANPADPERHESVPNAQIDVATPGQTKSSPARAFDQLLKYDYYVKAAFYGAREAVRRAKAAREAVPALREAAIDKEGQARLVSLKEDPNSRKKFSFATGVTLALMFSLFDVIPGNISAQAFGFDNTMTIAITALLTIALASVTFATAEARAGWQRWVTIAFLMAGLAAIGLLRWNFIAVTTADPMTAIVEAIGLTLFTLIILGLGVATLAFTKSRRVSGAEAEAAKARQAADAKQTEAEGLAERARNEESSILSLTLAFSAAYFADDEVAREEFIEYVENELHR